MEQAIDDLGGAVRVAEALGLSRTRVANWRARGIPWEYRPAIADLLREARKPVPPELIPPKARIA